MGPKPKTPQNSGGDHHRGLSREKKRGGRSEGTTALVRAPHRSAGKDLAPISKPTPSHPAKINCPTSGFIMRNILTGRLSKYSKPS